MTRGARQTDVVRDVLVDFARNPDVAIACETSCACSAFIVLHVFATVASCPDVAIAFVAIRTRGTGVVVDILPPFARIRDPAGACTAYRAHCFDGAVAKMAFRATRATVFLDVFIAWTLNLLVAIAYVTSWAVRTLVVLHPLFFPARHRCFTVALVGPGAGSAPVVGDIFIKVALILDMPVALMARGALGADVLVDIPGGGAYHSCHPITSVSERA
jgi:hypothetical protein